MALLGYTQEINVLLRTVVEYANQIRFVLVGIDEEGLPSTEAAEFISSYFKDSGRYTSSKNERVKLVQKRVHDIVGADLDAFRDETSDDMRRSTDMLSNVYVRFSYYVHARYPESMDLYGGGWPGRFHLSGMAGTPKDDENLQALDTLITSASLCLRGMVQSLRLEEFLSSDPTLREWMANVLSSER